MRHLLSLSAAALLGATLFGAVATSAQAADLELQLPSCTQSSSLNYANRQIVWSHIPSIGSGDFSCILRQGDNGPAVSALQYALNRCHGGQLKVDGNFGTGTKDALVRAQKASGITGDGIYGQRTRKIIDHNAFMGHEPGQPEICAPPKLVLGN